VNGWTWFFAIVSLLLAVIIAVLTWILRRDRSNHPSGLSLPESSVPSIPTAEVEQLRRDLHEAGGSVARLTKELSLEREQTGRNLETIAKRAEVEIQQRVALARTELEREFAERKRTDRQVSNQLSRAALLAKVAEHMGPLFPGFPYNLKECRHVGEVFDYLVYEGLEAGGDISVIFLEIKSSASGRTRRVTNPREKALRDAIKAGRVHYKVWQPPNAAELERLAREAIESLEVPALTEGGDNADS
jgi:predicted Holliday junction resolvase-like endonuclease